MADRKTTGGGGKGFFGHARLSVARVYPFISARRKVLVAGAALVGLLFAYSLFDLSLGGAEFVSSGPLSSSHATIDPAQSCNGCHAPMAGVTDQKCQTCHERFNSPIGVFSLASHRSVVREPGLEGSTVGTGREVEQPACADCHLEHQGRLASITDVRNSNCQSCHGGIDSFEDDHPQFDHVELNADGQVTPERPGLKFTHIKHVRRLLEDELAATAEAACASCHGLKDTAAHFEPIAYDEHCASCHNEQFEETEALPVVQVPRNGTFELGSPIGVETLSSVRQRKPFGSAWTESMSERGFETSGGQVAKLNVRHADPWILHNLALLRSRIVQRGLAELLDSIPESAADYTAAEYREAIRALEAMSDRLSEGAQSDKAIRERIDLLRARLASPTEKMGGDLFASAPRAGVSEEEREAVLELADLLGDACSTCHLQSEAAIVTPPADQRVLHNARFDHGAHVIQRGCLGCHTTIPVAEFATNDEKIPKGADAASVINVPGIANCQECHSSKLASDQCVGCHDYHPHQEARARFVQRSPAPESEGMP